MALQLKAVQELLQHCAKARFGPLLGCCGAVSSSSRALPVLHSGTDFMLSCRCCRRQMPRRHVGATACTMDTDLTFVLSQSAVGFDLL